MFSTKNPNLIAEEEKKGITVLDISNQDFGNSNSIDYQKRSKTLHMKGFENLQVFICSHNEIEELIFDEVSAAKLERLDCSFNSIWQIKLTGKADNLEKLIANDNGLQDINFLTSLNSEKLTYFDIRNNNFKHNAYYGSRSGSYPQNFYLSSFTKFTKLELLMLGNEKEHHFSSGYGGSSTKRCTGSLAEIRELNNLKKLSVRNSDITGDLEYLPKNLKLENFDYNGCLKIEEELEPFKGQNDPLKLWREKQRYYKLYQEVREKEINPLQQKLTQEENNSKREKEKSASLQRQLEIKKNELENKQKELEQTKNYLSSYQQFVNNLLKKKNDEIEKLSNQAKSKLEGDKEWLETFFRAQKEISRNNDSSFVKEQSEKAQSILSKKLSENELQTFLNKQKELWQLEKQLVDLNIYEERYEIKIEVPAKK